MSEGIAESRFYMWRAVVAMVHADGVVTAHELAFVNDYIHDIGLSSEQMKTISQDLQTPQDIYDMYAKIGDIQDKRDFFALARALSWCDGDLDGQEKHIIECLEEIHMNDESMNLLAQSREVFNELELPGDQWKIESSKNDSLFGFLSGLRAAS